MLLKFPKETFMKHLEIVEKGIPAKPVVLSTANVYVEKKEGILTFMANDLELAIKSTMSADRELEDVKEDVGSEAGKEVSESEASDGEKVLLPVKFIEIIRHLSGNKDVQVNIEKDSKKIEIRSGDAFFNLKGINADDYPMIKEEAPEKKPLVIKEKELKEIIKLTVFATASDDGRPAFTGVYFLIENKKLNIIASDTYRMVVEERDSDLWDYEVNKFLVPAKALKELQKILSDDGGEVIIYPIDNQLAFSFSHVFFVTRLLQDNYPDFRRVLPSSTITKVVMEKEVFEEIIGRAYLVCDKESNAVRLTVEDDLMRVKSSSEQGEMEDELKLAEKEGEDIDILLNVRFLIDFLKVAGSEKIVMEFSGREAPCIIRPDNNSNYLYLVLPIKVEQPL